MHEIISQQSRIADGRAEQKSQRPEHWKGVEWGHGPPLRNMDRLRTHAIIAPRHIYMSGSCCSHTSRP